MTVKELIAVLQTLDQDAKVQIGYEEAFQYSEYTAGTDDVIADAAGVLADDNTVTISLSTYMARAGKLVFPKWEQT